MMPNPPRPAAGTIRPVASIEDLQEQKLTVQQAARAMGVSKMTVFRLIHSHELAAYKIRKQYRIRLSAVREFLGDAEIGEWQ